MYMMSLIWHIRGVSTCPYVSPRFPAWVRECVRAGVGSWGAKAGSPQLAKR